ncbi:hypothetical protein LAZ67_4000648 [Cordylochernes scorpioides]|uniref:Mos1 transposase HTH domain-containing protein n=1 Tax=Cordylochernes scorpioides TaxID=51811 RepID=A0ABY6KBF0_9ARAC|nr:hypothetical protein LAZ67_4000648 [Cordylochernes scorpioides]
MSRVKSNKNVFIVKIEAAWPTFIVLKIKDTSAIALMLNHFFHPVNQLCNSGVVPLSRRVRVALSYTLFNAKNNYPVEIHRQLVEVYGEKCMDIKNVRKWCREFNEGRINVHEEQRSGRPSLP